MAGLWIKARADLRTEPMFLALHRALLLDGSPSPLLRRCIPSLAECGSPEEAVTLASRLVRDDVFALVTYSTLLDVWASVNAHCSVDGDDALMTPMTIPDIDRIAGVAGFGLAMALVGWAWQDGDNSVRFPDFRKWNEPACLRLESAQTSKERARRYRDRKRAERDAARHPSRDASVTGDVTDVTNDVMRNGITEQNRTDTNTPLPPLPKAVGTITDPAEAAALVIAEEGRWAVADWPALKPPAVRIVAEYERLVRSAHRAQGKAIACVVKILAHGVASPLLTEAARRYAAHQDRIDANPTVRKGAGAFYGDGDWQQWLMDQASAQGQPAPPPTRPELTEEDRAAARAELERRRKGGPDDAP